MNSAPKNLTALYGGSFDPPHNGHLSVINLLINAPEIQKIWLVPSGDHRPDKSGARSAAQRLKMCQLMVQEHFGALKRVEVCDFHALDLTKGYGTIDLLRYSREQHPELSFGVVIGSELVADLPRWRESEALLREATFIVTPRVGHDFDENVLRSCAVLSLVSRDMAKIEISSTGIRSRLAMGLAIEGLVPASVAAYIENQTLYSRKERNEP